MHGSLRDVDAADDPGLPPRRWIAEEPLVYDGQRNELHRRDCDHAAGARLTQGEALSLVWAPRMVS